MRGERRVRTGAALSAAVAAAAVGVCVGAWPVADRTAAEAAAAQTAVALAGSSQGLDVLPFPGTPDASPGTNVDFPAVSPAQIASVRVEGSRSGVHAGRLRAQPDNSGSAFAPYRPFAAGERVSVSARLRSAAAGTASGAPGARQLTFSFSVAQPVSVKESARAPADVGAPAANVGAPAAATPSKFHSFVTEPGFHVPWISMRGKDTDTTSGHIFLDAGDSVQHAAYMLNGGGKVLWYQPSSSRGDGPGIFNVRVQNYQGQRVITYWHGGKVVCPPCAGEHGRDLIVNSSYQTIHTVTAGNGYHRQGPDLHEFTLGHKGSEGVAFLQLWYPVQHNLTSVGGPAKGTVYDWIIQEVDIATNKVIWEWHALGHVPIDDTYRPYVPGHPFDYFHMNSIQQLPDGRLLVSARDTWAVYSIDMKTGKIAWELGGKHSSFKMGPHTHFYWQHDATLRRHGIFTVFDDGAAPREQTQSRALVLHLFNHRATLVHAYTHKPPKLATSMGSVQILPDHNVFVGWSSSYFSEYAPGGRQIFSGDFPAHVQSYRAFRLPWTGHPTWLPRIAVRKASGAGHYKVYVSWNGATQVKHWQVLGASSSAGPFRPIRRALWASFETEIPISTTDSYFKVDAEGAKYNRLPHGTSAVVRAGS